MVHTVQHIQSILKPHKAGLLQEYPIKRLGIFGSVVHGDARPDSDVDMLVELTKPIGMFRFLALEDALSRIVGSRIDLVTPGALKSIIRDDILRDTIYV